MVFKSIIFDLDGTLVDSLPGIEYSAQVAIGRVMPEIPTPNLAPLIGPPIAKMFAQLWPNLAPSTMASLLAEFRTIYDGGGCLKAQLYPGVKAVLDTLRISGYQLFLLTNKPFTPSLAILSHFELVSHFVEIHTPDSPCRFTAKPEGAQQLVQKHGLQPEETALVGDGQDDAESAACCGFTFFYSRYGYGKVNSVLPKNTGELKIFSDLEHFLHLPTL